MAKQKAYFTSEIRITFTGETPIDKDGNKEIVDMVSKTAVAMISAFKNTYPDIKVVPEQNTTYSEEPIEVKTTTKKLT